MTSAFAVLFALSLAARTDIDLFPDLTVELERPASAFPLGEPMPLRVVLRNNTPADLRLGPFGIEDSGQVMVARMTHFCGRGVCRSETLIIDNSVEVSVEPIIERAAAGDGEEEIVVEEVLLDEQFPDEMFEFTLQPGAGKSIEFDLMKTKWAAMIDRPGEYQVSIEFDFSCGHSQGYAVKELPWQGRAVGGPIRVRVLDGRHHRK